jgi:VWA domain-containing protein
MTFLTPLGGFVALLALLPLGAAIFAHGRTEFVRRALRLPPPERRAELLPPSLAAAGIVLLGFAAAQPALTRSSSPRVRRDVQALFVLDTSRSMAASSSATAPTRLDRAAKAAIRLRAAIPQVESGVLTLTDRVLPDLLPVADVQGFGGVVERAVRIESPPPRASAVRATSYGALADVATGNAFASTAARRIVILLTDGESNPVQSADLAGRLAAGRGYRFVAVRFWQGNESVYGVEGKVEASYRPDPSGRTTLRDLAVALGGRSFEEGELGAAAAYLRGLAGSGPTVRVAGTDRSRIALAPYLALPALLGLLAALGASIFAPAGIRLRRQ